MKRKRKPLKRKKKPMEVQTAEAPPLTVVPVEPPKRTCKASEILSASLINLVQMAPENPIVRSHVLAAIKVPLPEDARTTEQIIDWIEFNITNKVKRPDPSFPVVTVVGNLQQTVSGSCWFNGVRSGHLEQTLNAGMIYQVIEEQMPEGQTSDINMEGFVDEVMRALRQIVIRRADEDGAQWVYRAETLRDVDVDDAENITCGMQDYRSTVRNAVYRFLQTHTPAIYNQLINR